MTRFNSCSALIRLRSTRNTIGTGIQAYPKTKDEQTVNAALIDFLNAFIVHCGLSVQWTLHRKLFVGNFAEGTLKARNDECLGGNSYADNTIAVCMHPKLDIKYLNNTLDPDDDPGFMTMHRYGPWDTREVKSNEEGWRDSACNCSEGRESLQRGEPRRGG